MGKNLIRNCYPFITEKSFVCHPFPLPILLLLFLLILIATLAGTFVETLIASRLPTSVLCHVGRVQAAAPRLGCHPCGNLSLSTSAATLTTQGQNSKSQSKIIW